ncbi:MAG TPA: DNA methyltransferase [Candidatus Xenobia bacterium]|jgi:DNA modification methylase
METDRYHPKNGLNHLSGREWIKFTRTWFVHDPPRRSADEMGHPAKYPEGVVEPFIEFFTRVGQVVLDPFAGVGSTLVAADRLERVSVGVEIVPEFAQVAQERLAASPRAHLLVGDSRRLREHLAGVGIEQVDFTMTSPPYWDMLSKSRGGVLSVHKKRRQKGLAIEYSAQPENLGNLTDYRSFLQVMGDILGEVHRVTRPGGYMVVVVQNMRTPEGEVQPYAWDLTATVRERGWLFQGERIWCQDNKALGIWGYPSVFVPNYHHHYCLIFRRRT